MQASTCSKGQWWQRGCEGGVGTFSGEALLLATAKAAGQDTDFVAYVAQNQSFSQPRHSLGWVGDRRYTYFGKMRIHEYFLKRETENEKATTYLPLYRQWQSFELFPRHLRNCSSLRLPFLNAVGP
jgi:hypothetical protein